MENKLKLRKSKSLLLFSILFFSFFISFSSAYVDGDAVCYSEDDLLCTDVFILGDNYYCDIEDVIICENGCAEDRCIGIENPECSVGHEKCENNSIYVCRENEWVFEEICSDACVEQLVDYVYCDISEPVDSGSYITSLLSPLIPSNSFGYVGNSNLDIRPAHLVNYVGNISGYSGWRTNAFDSTKCNTYNLKIFNATSLIFNSSYIPLPSPNSTKYTRLPFIFPENIYLNGVSYFVIDGYNNINGKCDTGIPIFANGGVSNVYFTYNTTTESFTAGASNAYLSFAVTNLSRGSVSLVEEGGSCGYNADGGPFCVSNLSCDYFQCTATDDPTCSEVGGNTCVASACSTGLYFENTIENWCCNGECESETLGEIGDWCASSSNCIDGLSCLFFRCEDPANVTPGNYGEFCDVDGDCDTGLFCRNTRCNYNKTSWSISPSECSPPNDVPCNSGDCVVHSSNCGVGGVAGVDCTWDDFLINVATGQKEPCRRFDRFTDTFSPMFPSNQSRTYELTIIAMTLMSFVALMFVGGGVIAKNPLIALTFSFVGCILILYFFARIGYIGYTIPNVIIILSVVALSLKGGRG